MGASNEQLPHWLAPKVRLVLPGEPAHSKPDPSARGRRRRHLHLPPAESSVECGGQTHTIRWERGKLRLLDHDLRAERAVQAVGAMPPECVMVLRAWQQVREFARPDDPQFRKTLEDFEAGSDTLVRFVAGDEPDKRSVTEHVVAKRKLFRAALEHRLAEAERDLEDAASTAGLVRRSVRTARARIRWNSAVRQLGWLDARPDADSEAAVSVQRLARVAAAARLRKLSPSMQLRFRAAAEVAKARAGSAR